MSEVQPCRYFTAYSGVSLPFRLVGELTEAEICNRNTFFEGYYDAGGRLRLLRKLVYGETELEHRYVYDEGGRLQRTEITDADGEITVLTPAG